jgi:hypothetical protein
VIPSKVEPLYKIWWSDGHVPIDYPSLAEIRQNVQNSLKTLRQDHKRSLNPTPYKVSSSCLIFTSKALIQLPIWRLAHGEKAFFPTINFHAPSLFYVVVLLLKGFLKGNTKVLKKVVGIKINKAVTQRNDWCWLNGSFVDFYTHDF